MSILFYIRRPEPERPERRHLIHTAPAIFFILKNKNQIQEDYARGCPRSRKVRRLSHYDVIDQKETVDEIVFFCKLIIFQIAFANCANHRQTKKQCAEWLRQLPDYEKEPKVNIQVHFVKVHQHIHSNTIQGKSARDCQFHWPCRFPRVIRLAAAVQQTQERGERSLLVF